MDLKVMIVNVIDESSYPIWVECKLVDADGREHFFQDKLPIFSLSDDITIPCEEIIRCTVVEKRGETVLVDTSQPDDVQSKDGNYLFEVNGDQIISE